MQNTPTSMTGARIVRALLKLLGGLFLLWVLLVGAFFVSPYWIKALASYPAISLIAVTAIYIALLALIDRWGTIEDPFNRHMVTFLSACIVCSILAIGLLYHQVNWHGFNMVSGGHSFW